MSQLDRQRRREQRDQPPARGRRVLLPSIAIVVAIVAGAAWLLSRPSVGVPPEAPVADMDEAVAAQIARSRQKVLDAPRAGAAWLELGLVYGVNAMAEPARACLEQAVLLLPRDAKAWFHLGRIRAEQGDADLALAAFARARDLDPRYPASSWRRGFILLERDDLAGARAEFEAALRASPGDVPGTAGLARVALAQGDGATAERLVRPLARARPKDDSLRFLLGSALRLQGRLDEAAAELGASSAPLTRWHDPWELDALIYQVSTFGQINQALAASEDGHHDHAIRLLERLLAREPDTASVVVNLASEYVAVGRAADALTLLDRFLVKEPDHALAHAVYAEAAFAAERFEDVVAHAARAREIDPSTPHLGPFEAGALSRLGRHGDAVAAFERAIAETPEDGGVRFGLGVTLRDLGRLEDAAVALRDATRADPAHATAWHALAITELDLGRLDEAEAAFRMAGKLGALKPPQLTQALAEIATARSRRAAPAR